MLTKEQKDRLTPEQLIIAERWDKEKERRLSIMNRLQEAYNDKNEEEVKISFDEFMDEVENTPSHCEHGRSVNSTCSACDELEELLYGKSNDQMDD